MIGHAVNELNNFIAGWFLSDELCDRMFEKIKTKINTVVDVQKELPYGNRNYFYTSFFQMFEPDLEKEYFESLQEVLLEYQKKYEYCDCVSSYQIGNDYKIQYYKPNKCYSSIHCENSGIYDNRGWRHLTFMTYLNDISDGGETEFIYQNIKVRPEKGLTLIWPSQWTHMHRGLPTQSEKYILTGWYYFVNDMTNRFIVW